MIGNVRQFPTDDAAFLLGKRLNGGVGMEVMRRVAVREERLGKFDMDLFRMTCSFSHLALSLFLHLEENPRLVPSQPFLLSIKSLMMARKPYKKPASYSFFLIKGILN